MCKYVVGGDKEMVCRLTVSLKFWGVANVWGPVPQLPPWNRPWLRRRLGVESRPIGYGSFPTSMTGCGEAVDPTDVSTLSRQMQTDVR